MSFGFWLLLFALAGFVGFFADRTSICTVKAITEILTTRHAYMLLSFGKTVLWVTGVSTWLAWWLGSASPDATGFAINWTSLFGGLIFGFGAVFNGGCALATIKHLGNGELEMLITIAAFAIGVAAIETLSRFVDGLANVQATPWIELQFSMAATFGVLISIWMLWEVVRLWRSASDRHPRTILFAAAYRLSTAAAIIGISNGLLYGLVGTWAYTHTLRRSVSQLISPDTAASGPPSMVLLWLLFLGLVSGVCVSAVVNRRFSMTFSPGSASRGHFGGGLLMGCGAALIPGGNDVLLLNAIPGMSPHGIPAYVATLAGVFIALTAFRRHGRELGVVRCTGDLCLDARGHQST